MEWLKKNKDWLLTLAVFIVFGLIGLIWSLFFREDPAENHLEIVREKVVFNAPTDQQNTSNSSEKNESPTSSSTFYLEPGPTEILEKLEGMNYQEFREEAEKLPGLKVMWPAYFFSIRKMEKGMAEVLFDVSEDGFGALILTSIDTSKYSEILTLNPGTKIWLAGEITGIDPSGTGEFYISTEFVEFDDYQPQLMPRSAADQQSE